MNKQELGKQLKSFLAMESDIVKISRWAFKIYSNNRQNLDPSLREILECLFSMEDDPQFEYTEQELRLLAEKLINNEKDPIKQINDMKSKELD
jgi:hypothetical protein